MTSPERIRRRQRIEIFLILLLLSGMIAQQWYFGNRYEEHTECLETKIREMNNAYSARSEVSADEFALVDATIFSIVLANGQTEVRQALENYRTGRGELQRERRTNPVPPFPGSECKERVE